MKHTNRLAGATSPYLLQHAHNPVDWYPWGEEALARARAEDKPILLSIGYSACHWCHVMERESFENEDIAALMNRDFVCIKVDREERPDLDDIYMAATLAMNQGHGGWPMTVFLTPDQQPFFAGTYFPPEDRHGRPGFPTLLARIALAWTNDRHTVESQGADLVRYLQRSARAAPGGLVGEEQLQGALDQLTRDFDARYGGFGGAPKFPPSGALSLLLRCHRRFGDAHALAMVTQTLDAMARGGVYDQIGGGFHRYSVDEHWLVPHFEKMLYDNALLASVYLEGFQATGNPFYERIAREVLDYVLREMTGSEGGFCSATDADSEGVEGRFFVWTPEQVHEALGDKTAADRFCAYYDITPDGNWEGHAIPNTSRTGARVAKALGVDPEELERSVAASRQRLYEERLKRVTPGRDDKVLTAWNGLMISAMAEGARVFGDARYLLAAERAGAFLLDTLSRPDGRLLRTWRAGTAHLDAYLEDYAFLADGLVSLYEAGGALRWLRAAERLADIVREDFSSEEGGFYATAAGHEKLIVRHREGHDGAIPSANAAAASALARLSYHLDRADLRQAAEQAIQAYGRAVAKQPRAFARSLAVVDLMLEGPVELAFVGPEADVLALKRAAARHYLPNRIVAHGDGTSSLPLLAGKDAVGGRGALYVCRDYACQRPITDPEAVPAALSSQPSAESPRTVLGAPRLAGSATPEGTAAFAARRPQAVHGYARLGSTELTVSRIGFGGYRIDDEAEEHRAALARALGLGCNLVDTSTNYTGGGSERLIGEVIAEQVRAGALRREEIVVVSKIGYVQGDLLEQAKEQEAEGKPLPEVVKYSDNVWHSMHPEFLAEQLERSLQRLRLETLDVCLLHNPEYFLLDAHERSHGRLDTRRAEFHARLQKAFAFLETQVAAGRIRFYGVSSNTCNRRDDDAEFVSLEHLLAAARAAGGASHHFRVLQMPLNLVESGALLVRNNGPEPRRSVIEHAEAHDVGVLVNRPLNVLVDEGIVRLADVDLSGPDVSLEAQLAAVSELEDEYRREIGSQLQAAEGGVPPGQFFRWGQELRGIVPHLRGVEHWEALQAQRVLPRVMQVLEVLDQNLAGSLVDTWTDWRRRYVPALQTLLSVVRKHAALKSRAVLERVRGVLDPLLPSDRQHETLSRKALWVLVSTPGVECVLNGARTTDYADDSLAVLGWPKLERALRVYEQMHGIVLTAEPAE